MKKNSLHLVFLAVLTVISFTSNAQKKLAEFTLIYDYSITGTGSDQKPGSTTQTVYIKANLSRTETISNLFSSVTIHDTKTGTGVILKEVSGQKLLIRITPENWEEKNRQYEGISFSPAADTKVIAGYKCNHVTATTKNGSTLSVFYTKDLVPENKDYDAQFKSLDGLPMEYELTNKNIKIKYTLASINFNPVPASKFDIPKSGYREMTYEESRKN